MKKFVYTVAAIAFVVSGTSVVLAGHHEGGERGEKMEKMLEKRFDENDLDKNGSVSKSEFLVSAEKKFASIDADGNGLITKDEMKSHMKEKRNKMKEKREKGKEKSGE